MCVRNKERERGKEKEGQKEREGERERDKGKVNKRESLRISPSPCYFLPFKQDMLIYLVLCSILGENNIAASKM